MWKSKDKNSVLDAHDKLEHNGEKADYRMTVLRKYKSAFERQNNEPARIKISKVGENINSKLEWNNQAIERIRNVDIYSNRIENENSQQLRDIVRPETDIESERKKAGHPKGS